MKQKKLVDAVVGDYVIVATGVREATVVCPVLVVTGEGAKKRIFTEPIANPKKEWRRGFDVISGRQATATFTKRTLIRFATPDEKAEYEEKRERHLASAEAYRAQQARPEAIDASFILSCTDDQLIAVGLEHLREFANLVRVASGHDPLK